MRHQAHVGQDTQQHRREGAGGLSAPQVWPAGSRSARRRDCYYFLLVRNTELLAEVDDLLTRFGLRHIAGLQVREIAYGQRRLVEIMLALALALRTQAAPARRARRLPTEQ